MTGYSSASHSMSCDDRSCYLNSFCRHKTIGKIIDKSRNSGEWMSHGMKYRYQNKGLQKYLDFLM